MLNELRSYFAYHIQAILLSFNGLCKRPLASFMTIIVIAIALTLPALFWVFTDNIYQLTHNWKEGGRITLFLKPSLKPEEGALFFKKVKKIPEIKQAALKTKMEGLIELQKQEGMRDIMRYLPENPLPAVIEVLPNSTINTPGKMENLYHQLKNFPEVDEAKLDLMWITRLHAIVGFTGKIAKGLMVLLALAVVLIIGNTLRMTIQHKQEEIQVLKLVGASDLFIRRPFLYTGIWYGLLGAVFSVLFVNIFMLGIAVAVEQLAFAYHMHYPLLGLSFRQALLIIVAAIALSWLGAGLAVKRQLSSIEPLN